MEALGGIYDVLPSGVIRVENCLFREACDAAGVICYFHAGAMSRLLEDTIESVDLEVLGRHGRSGCEYRVGTLAIGAERTASGT